MYILRVGIFLTTTIQKRRNSQGIRLPKHLLEPLKWSDTEKIIVKTQDNRIVIEQAEQETHPTITELFDGYSGNNTPEEIDWGESVGRESW